MKRGPRKPKTTYSRIETGQGIIGNPRAVVKFQKMPIPIVEKNHTMHQVIELISELSEVRKIAPCHAHIWIWNWNSRKQETKEVLH